MHTTILGLAIGVIAAPILAGCSPPAPKATEVTQVVAVDADGRPQDGYHEQPSTSTVGAVSDCAASPAAVSTDIYQCWPAAAAADVCWPSTPDSLLCVGDPWDKQLHRVSVGQPPPHVPPANDPQPFALLLDDGSRCRLRNGGAWGGRDDGYLGAYECRSPAVTVLADPDGDVIDRSGPTWTVQVGELGAGDVSFPPPQTRAVVGAWFAGVTR
jgi:hypothetical protein